MPYRKGFTLVELLIVIAVIAILAAISIVAYNGAQDQSKRAVMAATLKQAASTMLEVKNQSGSYPTTLPTDYKHPDTVSVSISSTSVYNGLSATQNGLLFYNICGELVSDGYGTGTNNGGSQESYITACNVYNHPELQVNAAWSAAGRTIDAPVDASTLPDIASSISGLSDSYRPNADQVVKDFYNEWNTRFTSEGGYYPVTTFWDSWATPGNGVMKPTLPTPTAGGGWVQESGFCAQAIYTNKPSLKMYALNTGAPQIGACPAAP